MSTQTTPTWRDILTDSEIVHVVCGRTDVALCGTKDDAWVDVEDGPDCVVCLDIEATDTPACPVTGGPCDCVDEP